MILKTKINFEIDIKISSFFLEEKIKNKSFLIIGGAWTIGSNYIKQILRFKPIKITVVDINENSLT